jgi:molybdate transport system substrate-binding protein
VFITAWLLTSVSVKGQQSSKVLIAAASDLKYALDSIISVFKNVNREARVDVAFGSSGKLYEQISNGAPFDLFFSADIDYPSKLEKKGFIVDRIQPYGIGRIVLWSKKIDPTSSGLEVLLKKSIVKIAIANPAHAPYGRRAEEALKKSEIYDQVKDKLVYGENISQTAQFVTTGAADAGIVALSLALSPTMKKMNGYFYVIPDSLHSPLMQAFVMLKHGERHPVALRFKNFMLTKEAREILSYFGFTKINPTDE